MGIDNEGHFRLSSGDVLKITFKGNPATKKNSQRIMKNSKTGAPFISPSAKYKAYENECLWSIHKQAAMLRRSGKPIKQKVNVCVAYFMESRRRVDLVNLLEATLDILVSGGILADDCADIVAGTDGSAVYYDSERPRAEIYIMPYADVKTTANMERWAE